MCSPEMPRGAVPHGHRDIEAIKARLVGDAWTGGKPARIARVHSPRFRQDPVLGVILEFPPPGVPYAPLSWIHRHGTGKGAEF